MLMVNYEFKLTRLIKAGFDLSSYNRETREFKVKCSGCRAAIIAGVPCHELGCRNLIKAQKERKVDPK